MPSSARSMPACCRCRSRSRWVSAARRLISTSCAASSPRPARSPPWASTISRAISPRWLRIFPPSACTASSAPDHRRYLAGLLRCLLRRAVCRPVAGADLDPGGYRRQDDLSRPAAPPVRRVRRGRRLGPRRSRGLSRRGGSGFFRRPPARRARLLFTADTWPGFFDAFFGAQYAGLLPVPISIPVGIGGKTTYLDQLRRQFAASGAVAALGLDDLAGYLAEVAQDFSAVRLHGGMDALAVLPEKAVDLRPLGPADLCYIQFSSGS